MTGGLLLRSDPWQEKSEIRGINAPGPNRLLYSNKIHPGIFVPGRGMIRVY
jgi:hypothetical protein